MNIIDSHFHWYPRAYFELLLGREESPRAERKGSTYHYWWAKEKGSAEWPPIWFELEEEFVQVDKMTGQNTGVLNSGGVLTTDLAELPIGLAEEISDACNNEFAKMQSRFRDRFWSSAFVPFQDPEAAIKTLDHAVKLGLYGVNVPSSVGGQGLDHPRFEPFYAHAAKLGVPLILHASDSDIAQLLMDRQDGMVHAGLGRPFESSVAALRLILAGVMERHQSLKVILFHVGGVLPYMAGRLDKNSHIKSLPKPPSHYVSKLYTDTVSPAPLGLKMAIEFFGVDRVMFGSDFPCWSPAAALKVLNEINLSNADKEKILYRNVVKLFGLKVLESAI